MRFPEQGPPGSDLELMRRQHLDAERRRIGMLMPLSRAGMEERNLEFAAALASAVNDWQLETWVKPEPRLRAGIVVPQEDAAFAVAEIERRAERSRLRADPDLAARQRPARPSPLLADLRGGGALRPPDRAARAGLQRRPRRRPPSGWPTYYMQEHYAMTSGMQTTLASLVFEGVFERFPKLKVVLIEGGFAWAPALCWRMDKHWERMRKETPHVKRPPSEYVREHVWFTTQPIEEPESRGTSPTSSSWIGWDRLMFSTDYPHWDFDHPRTPSSSSSTDDAEGDGLPGQRQGVVRPAVSRHVVAQAERDRARHVQDRHRKGREIGIFNLDGEYFALANRCPHAGGPLCKGRIVGSSQSDGPGHYRLVAAGRVRALPLARLGVRHPHRPVLVRSEIRPGASSSR